MASPAAIMLAPSADKGPPILPESVICIELGPRSGSGSGLQTITSGAEAHKRISVVPSRPSSSKSLDGVVRLEPLRNAPSAFFATKTGNLIWLPSPLKADKVTSTEDLPSRRGSYNGRVSSQYRTQEQTSGCADLRIDAIKIHEPLLNVKKTLFPHSEKRQVAPPLAATNAVLPSMEPSPHDIDDIQSVFSDSSLETEEKATDFSSIKYLKKRVKLAPSPLAELYDIFQDHLPMESKARLLRALLGTDGEAATRADAVIDNLYASLLLELKNLSLMGSALHDKFDACENAAAAVYQAHQFILEKAPGSAPGILLRSSEDFQRYYCTSDSPFYFTPCYAYFLLIAFLTI